MRLTGAEQTIAILREQGVSVVFGYPGGQILPVYDALRREPAIRHILTAHEQGAAHAADGYARASGAVGVVLATSGPGATNLVTGLAAAYADSIPVVAITGNVPRGMVGRDGFQEVDTWGLSLPVTKHSFLVQDTAQLADTLRAAFRIAQTGRKGPVLVDLPKDVQLESCDFVPQARVQAISPPPVPEETLTEAAALLTRAKRPYLYCGGGVVSGGASAELEQLAERLDAPIGCSMMGLSAIPDANPRKLGMQGMHGRYASSVAMEEADLLLALGVRFSDRAHTVTGKKVIHIDVDAAEIGKNIPAYLGMTGELQPTLSALLPLLPQMRHPTWQKRIATLEAAEQLAMPQATERLHPFAIIRAICQAMPNAIYVTDVGQHQIWAAQACVFTRPRTFLTSGGLGAMGFGMGAAIGAAFAVAGERVVLFTGDGSFGMNCPELATAVTCDLPLTIVVLNNAMLGMIRQWQDVTWQGHRFACDPQRKTDFVRLAEAFGAKGWLVTDEASLQTALQAAMAIRSPTLLDCRISPEWNVTPMLVRPEQPLE